MNFVSNLWHPIHGRWLIGDYGDFSILESLEVRRGIAMFVA